MLLLPPTSLILSSGTFWRWLRRFERSIGIEVDLNLRGIYLLKAAGCTFASLNLSTTVSTEVLKSPEGEIGVSRRKDFFSP